MNKTIREKIIEVIDILAFIHKGNVRIDGELYGTLDEVVEEVHKVLQPILKEDAFKWFKKGFESSAEGFNGEYIYSDLSNETIEKYHKKHFEEKWNDIMEV